MEEVEELFNHLGHVYLFGKNSYECFQFARRYGLPQDSYTIIDSEYRLKGLRNLIVIRLEGWSRHKYALQISRVCDSRDATYIAESEIEQALENESL